MKYLKTYEGMFDLFKKSEEDKLALDFITRLEKIKGESPYEIKKSNPNEIVGYLDGNITDGVIDYINKHGQMYKVLFDDVTLISIFIERASVELENLYGLSIDDEKIRCKEKYKKRIYDLVKTIFENSNRLKVVNKVRKNINPAADLL